MMRVTSLLLFCTMLSGCSLLVPVERSFPPAPPSLMTPPPELRSIPPDTQDLNVMLENITENYTNYRILKEKYQAWQDWYQYQKKNFDEVK